MEEVFLKSVTLRDAVYKELFKAIVTGDLSPGSKITIRGLAEKFNVSTQPVREAIHRLKAERMVAINNRRITVEELTKEEMEHLFLVHTTNIFLACEEAARNHDDEGLKKIKQYLDELRKSQDNQAFFQVARRFVLAYIQQAKNPILSEVTGFLLSRLMPYHQISLGTYTDKDRALLLKAYEGIYKALKNRDGEKVKKFAGQVLDNLFKHMLLALAYKEEKKIRDFEVLAEVLKVPGR